MVNSPLKLLVVPGAPEAAACELLTGGSSSKTIDALGRPEPLRAAGLAGELIYFAIRLRDANGNACAVRPSTEERECGANFGKDVIHFSSSEGRVQGHLWAADTTADSRARLSSSAPLPHARRLETADGETTSLLPSRRGASEHSSPVGWRPRRGDAASLYARYHSPKLLRSGMSVAGSLAAPAPSPPRSPPARRAQPRREAAADLLRRRRPWASLASEATSVALSELDLQLQLRIRESEASEQTLRSTEGLPAEICEMRVLERRGAAGQAVMDTVRIGILRWRAGDYEASISLMGRPVPGLVTVQVAPAPVHAPACGARGSGLNRCIAGVESSLELVARDRFGNTRPGPSGPWAVHFSRGHTSDTEGLEDSQFADDAFVCALAPGGGGAGGGVTNSGIITSGGFAGSSGTLARFTARVPGVHSLCVSCGTEQTPIEDMPRELRVVPAAFGAGLRRAVAGEVSSIWLVLDVNKPPAGAAAQLLQRVQLHFEDNDTGYANDAGCVSTAAAETAAAQVEEGVQASAAREKPSVSLSCCAADRPEAPGCFVVEAKYTARIASSAMRLHAALDGTAVLGSPFALQVVAGAAAPERAELESCGWSAGAEAGAWQQAVLRTRDAFGNACAHSHALTITLALKAADAPVHEFVLEPTAAPPHVTNLGDGSYLVKWQAMRSGLVDVLLWSNDALMACSRRVRVRGAAASAEASKLKAPLESRIAPAQWIALPLLLCDAAGNPAELLPRERLHITCNLVQEAEHVRLRECCAAEGQYEVWLFPPTTGKLELAITIDGAHVRHSPATLDVAAGNAVPERCYAFGHGLETPDPGAAADFTIVACDAAGVQRTTGGDDFRVAVSPSLQGCRPSSEHVRIRDNHSGEYIVSWIPYSTGTYHLSVTLGRVHIRGSPFKVKIGRVPVRGSPFKLENPQPTAAVLTRAPRPATAPAGGRLAPSAHGDGDCGGESHGGESHGRDDRGGIPISARAGRHAHSNPYDHTSPYAHMTPYTSPLRQSTERCGALGPRTGRLEAPRSKRAQVPCRTEAPRRFRLETPGCRPTTPCRPMRPGGVKPRRLHFSPPREVSPPRVISPPRGISPPRDICPQTSPPPSRESPHRSFRGVPTLHGWPGAPRSPQRSPAEALRSLPWSQPQSPPTSRPTSPPMHSMTLSPMRSLRDAPGAEARERERATALSRVGKGGQLDAGNPFGAFIARMKRVVDESDDGASGHGGVSDPARFERCATVDDIGWGGVGGGGGEPPWRIAYGYDMD